MTTFTLKDYIDNMTSRDNDKIERALRRMSLQDKMNLVQALEEFEKQKQKSQDVSVTVEPIPFAGYVNIQDKEDTEKMLRDQLHVVKNQLLLLQAENSRLKRKLRELGENE